MRLLKSLILLFYSGHADFRQTLRGSLTFISISTSIRRSSVKSCSSYSSICQSQLFYISPILCLTVQKTSVESKISMHHGLIVLRPSDRYKFAQTPPPQNVIQTKTTSWRIVEEQFPSNRGLSKKVLNAVTVPCEQHDRACQLHLLQSLQWWTLTFVFFQEFASATITNDYLFYDVPTHHKSMLVATLLLIWAGCKTYLLPYSRHVHQRLYLGPIY